MKTAYFLICTLILTQTAFAKAKKESFEDTPLEGIKLPKVSENPGEKLGPPIMIVADGTASMTASNILTDDCDQQPVFPEPVKPLPENGSATNFPPEAPQLLCDNSHPHLRGDITIHGQAAEELFKGMLDVKLHPGVPDILERDRNSLNWDDIPYKTGRNIWCYQYPAKKDGKAVLETSCRIEVSNLNKGEIDVNDQSH